jgi:pimeloyl-ACP methyl ester carboxylesterase
MGRKAIRIIVGILLGLFALLNVIGAFHAYKFTHFSTEKIKRADEHRLTGPDKIKTLFFGVDMPRPVDSIKPSQPFETVYLQSNVKLECWSLKSDSNLGTVIIFHGYGASKSKMIDRSDEFLKMGYNTLLVDFMGSGGSEGNSTTIGFKEAEEVKTAFDYVSSKGEKHIYLFGASMGAVSIMKAINDYHLHATGLILECPFGNMFKTVDVRVKKMGLHTFPTTYLLMFWGGLENGFWAFSHNPDEYARHIDIPVLLMYGEKDERVSRAEIDSIYTHLYGYKDLTTFPLCGHQDYIPLYHDIWVSSVNHFLGDSKAAFLTRATNPKAR